MTKDNLQPPETNYNLFSCFIIGLIGAILGALAISGLIIPVFVYLLNLLPQESLGIPREVSSIVCGGAFWFVILFIPARWGIQQIRHLVSSKQARQKQDEFDDYLDGAKKVSK
jgi:hypothetical protein